MGVGAAALLSALAISTHALWLQWLGNALVLGEPPAAADAVVVLAGGTQTRLPKGVELVHAGYAPTLYVLEDLVCPPLSTSGSCLRLSQAHRTDMSALLDDLVLRDQIVQLVPERPFGASSTAAEATLAWTRLRDRGVKRILLVTDEFHSRRATLVWRHAVAGQATIIPVPSVSTQSPIAGWWWQRRGIEAVSAEYAKFVVYGLMGRL